VIPGLRSLRSLTRGYCLPPLHGSLSAAYLVEFVITLFRFVECDATKQLVARGACSLTRPLAPTLLLIDL
jgi:hypothetical protein